MKVTRNNPELADALEQNIETILELRREAERSRSLQDRIADAITTFSGSMLFVYLHALLFAGWIVLNMSMGKEHAFDYFPFNFLTMVVSLEAIFLSTFVLVSQNRSAVQADDRADLDLQIDMLGEYEITKLLRLVVAIGRKLEVEGCDDKEWAELEKTVHPDQVLREMAQRKKEVEGK